MFKIVKNYFWPLLYSQDNFPDEYKAQSQKCLKCYEQCDLVLILQHAVESQ